MTTIAIAAIRAPRDKACEAMAQATKTKELTPPKDSSAPDDLNTEINQLLDSITEDDRSFPVRVWSAGEWTLFDDPQLVLPGLDEELQSISKTLATDAVGVLIQGDSELYGLVVCTNGKLVRNFIAIGGDIGIDEGSLDGGDNLAEDPSQGVESAWSRLVPNAPVEQLQLRVFSASAKT